MEGGKRKRRKQKEWLASNRLICPVCKSDNITSGDMMGPYEYERICNDCGTEFEERLKLVGYKITKKGEEV